MKYIFVTLFFFSAFFISCTEKKYFKDEVITEWASGDFKLGTPYSLLRAFVFSDSSKIALTNVGSLHYIFQNGYTIYILITSYDNFQLCESGK